MRGLKRKEFPTGLRLLVASFTDAWIETKPKRKAQAHCKVASFTDAWIETLIVWFDLRKVYVASFTDAGIETTNTRSCGILR